MKYTLLAAASICLPVALFTRPTAQPAAGSQEHLPDSSNMSPGDLPSIPLAFAPNMGQVDPAVQFTARGNSMHAFFTKGAMAFRLFPESEDSSLGANLFMNFEGSATASVTATKPLGASTHYLLGNASEEWVTNVPLYGEIQYQDLYRGIDLAVHNRDGGFEYDFELEPGVSSDVICLTFDGADSARVDTDGALLIETAAGTFAQQAPATWQVQLDGTKVEVASRFADLGGGRFGFELGQLDDALATVIDPLLIWATYLGGASCERVASLAMDGELYVYATGMTMGSDFPTTAVAFDLVADTRHEGVAFKLSPDGSTLIWSTYFGGEWDDDPNGLALVGGVPDGATGEVINRSPVIVGMTSSWDFPTTAGSFKPFKGAGSDGFALRLSPNGDSLDWSSFIGDRDIDAAWAVDTNKADEVVVVGETQSVDFGTPGAFQTVKGSHKDAFVVKIAADGASILWSSFIGGNNDDWALAVNIDQMTDEVAIGGVTNSTDFPTTVGAFGSTFLGGGDAWALRCKPDGSALIFSTLLSGSAVDVVKGIGTDDSGRTYCVGYTDSTDYPVTIGAIQTLPGGMRDGFVTAIDPSGTGLVYSTYLGGQRDDECHALDLDFLGVAFVTGFTESPDFPEVGIPVASGLTGFRDIFVTQIEKDGLSLEFSTYLGAGSLAIGETIAQDFPTGAITIGGLTRPNFPVTSGAYDTTFNGGSGDSVVVRLDPKPCVQSAKVQTLGTPCGAVLTSTLPIMGKPITVSVTGASPNALTFLFRSSAGATPVQIEGCDIWLDLTYYAQYPFFTDSSGSLDVMAIIPNDSARCGLQFVLQGLVIDPIAGPLSFGQITNGLLETMGS